MRLILLLTGIALLSVGNTCLATEASKSSPQGAHGRHDPHAALTPDQHLTVALQHQQEGRIDEALMTLTKAITRFPAEEKLLLVRGSIYLQQQQISKALQDFERAVEFAPDNADAYINRAQAYRHFGRFKQAYTDLDKAIELQPDSIPARFNRGSIYFSENAYQKALQDFEHCVAVDPHAPAPYFNRAATHDAMGQRDMAIADMKRFLELTENPDWKKAAEDILKRWSEENKEQATGKHKEEG